MKSVERTFIDKFYPLAKFQANRKYYKIILIYRSNKMMSSRVESRKFSYVILKQEDFQSSLPRILRFPETDASEP